MSSLDETSGPMRLASEFLWAQGNQWQVSVLGESQGSSLKRELSGSMVEQERGLRFRGVELQMKTGLASTTTTSLVYIVQD